MFKNQEKVVVNLYAGAYSPEVRMNWNGAEATVFRYNPCVEPPAYNVKITKPKTRHQRVGETIALYARDLAKIDHD